MNKQIDNEIIDAAELAATITSQTKSVNIQLGEPIVRGSGENKQIIDEFSIRKPLGGDLRGLSINSIANGDFDQLSALVPRITTPQITAADLNKMEFDDVTAISGILTTFLLLSKSKVV